MIVRIIKMCTVLYIGFTWLTFTLRQQDQVMYWVRFESVTDTLKKPAQFV